MKKLVSFFLCLVLSLCATYSVALAAVDDGDVFTAEQIEYYKSLGLQGTTVNVYNWGEYISDGSEDSMDVVSEFERLTGATVNYTNYESNENMYSKLAGGGVSYDVVVPSDYMIERLADEGMLQEIDWNNVPNRALIDEKYQNLYFDPEQKYSLCYNVGTTVLIYNKNLVSETPDSWSVLWDEQYKGKVLMFNNSRDALQLPRRCSARILTRRMKAIGIKPQSFLPSKRIKQIPFMLWTRFLILWKAANMHSPLTMPAIMHLWQIIIPIWAFAFPKRA